MAIKKGNKFLLMSAFVLVVFFVILLQVVNNGPMTNFDKIVNSYLVPAPGFLFQMSLFFHYTFGTIGFSLVLLILLGVFLFKRKHSHSLFVLSSLIGTIGLTYIVKLLVGRMRPQNILETDYSFPSGHAIYSFILVALLFYLFAYDIKNIYIKRIWATAGVLIILLVAFSRLYMQVHWFSDILGSWALGLVLFGIIVYLHERFKYLDKKNLVF